MVRVHKTNTVELTVHLKVSIFEFYENNLETSFIDKLAALLGIPIYKLKVVGIYKGSTIINCLVLDE